MLPRGGSFHRAWKNEGPFRWKKSRDEIKTNQLLVCLELFTSRESKRKGENLCGIAQAQKKCPWQEEMNRQSFCSSLTFSYVNKYINFWAKAERNCKIAWGISSSSSHTQPCHKCNSSCWFLRRFCVRFFLLYRFLLPSFSATLFRLTRVVFLVNFRHLLCVEPSVRAFVLRAREN